MRPLYSIVFIALAGLEGVAVFDVPDGRVAVARCLDVYANNSDILNTNIRFQDGLTGQTIWLKDWGVGQGTSAQWQGRQVFPPLGRIQLQAGNGPVDARLSGYLLYQP